MFARASLYVCVHACGCVAGVCSPCVDCVCTYLYTRAYVCAYVHKCGYMWCMCIHACGGYVVGVLSPYVDRVCVRACVWVHVCG